CTGTGGNGNYTWTVPSGFPAYLTFSGNTGSTVTISGTRNFAAPYNFTIKVSDSRSPVQTGSLQLAGQTGTANTGTGGTVLSSISPSSAPLNSAAVVISLIGSGFSSNSQVVFDGIP